MSSEKQTDKMELQLSSSASSSLERVKGEVFAYKIGVDAGSTTLKLIILDSANAVVYKSYTRHKANIGNVFKEELRKVAEKFPDARFSISMTGSAGMGIAERTGITFVQEVVASIEVVNNIYPETRTLIDLGGEDAKIVFFGKAKQPDIRMNGSCAGGTGAFIDQMADLMHSSVEELGRRALCYEKTYPVASRCGVFAKTDVQNLISRNVPSADVSKSILNTVALQSITSLARGHEIEPKILCIGGPLTFIPALRESFKELLNIPDDEFILPENGEYFPAWGAALHKDENGIVFDDIISLASKLEASGSERKDTLPVLFGSEKEYADWQANRKVKPLKMRELAVGETVSCFLGIDSGSTTTKILVMDEEDSIIYSFYAPNQGNPLKKVVEGIKKFYDLCEEKDVSLNFLSSAVTGYGEDLVKSALSLDYGIVETMAHLSGAQYVAPEVSFILDIGGQDIKSIFTRNGVISNIELNEACSSGCGSFLQNFASTMNMTLEEFTRAACLSEYPSDLGSRCTVFMNSKVKQSLRENAGLGDIAAGLAYSVVKNCLFKVLKISNLKLLGEHIVVQGGTFRNDAVYRALELLSGKTVSSTDRPELMGALGAALYAQKMWNIDNKATAFTGAEPLPDVAAIETRELQCKGCTNKCTVLRFSFRNGNTCYAGNKCEKVFFNKNNATAKGFNAFDRKNEILFNLTDNNKENRTNRTRIGIPRVLNIFDNYPFWHTLLNESGFEVVLSPESTIELFRKGAGSVMSDNICFPAKLVHGHIHELVEQKVNRIFYPVIPKEEKEFERTTNSYNCPVVSGYPDVVRSAMEPEEKFGIPFDKPIITFNSDAALEKSCRKYLSSLGVHKNVITKAVTKAIAARQKTKSLLRDSQREQLDKAVAADEIVFIVAGRPYHADSLIQQKVGQILTDLGVHVFTDDVFRHEESEGFSRLNMISQWSYPNRVVQAALEVAQLPQNVQLVQLNSFGCGPDSFFMDEIGEILKSAGKNHTILRIDEIASPGSIRLRLRSLVESLKTIHTEKKTHTSPYAGYNVPYTEDDRKKTILLPWFADFLSPFLPALGDLIGYKVVNLPRSSKQSADIGLQYGHNEVCYPSTLVLGDIIYGLQSGNYDLSNVVVAITQTGGQCRATNYVAQIKSGLTNAGFSDIPVIVLATGDVYQNEQKAFRIPVAKIANLAIHIVLYSDALQQMFNAVSIREQNSGETQRLFDFYIERGVEATRKNDSKLMFDYLRQAVADFNRIAVHEREYTSIGLIGEIYLKYNNYGQAHISEWLRSKGMEVLSPPLLDFLTQYFVNSEINDKHGISTTSRLSKMLLKPALWSWVSSKSMKSERIMKHFRYYHPSESIYTKAKYAADILSLSNQFGEGWAIAAEVSHYARHGINKVVCVQPFGCIANHIVAKGIEKRLKRFYPDMNLLYLDVDGGVADVNLQNRLHFMIS
ncbi:MAG: acyl-CoA dehydratase activase-related protein [Cytophagaceae bacterium]|jgi:predicted CoA-substrate-specific enzyme activase|nr:acyl-CoA dehydratase activase-related protein [Cytophagaceae bacterium]